MTARMSLEAAAVVRVRIPSPLRSYTGEAEIGVAVPVLAPELPPTVGGVLAALDVSYPGMRFRIVDEQGKVRPHVKLFVGSELARDLGATIPSGTDVDDRRRAFRRLNVLFVVHAQRSYSAPNARRIDNVSKRRSLPPDAALQHPLRTCRKSG